MSYKLADLVNLLSLLAGARTGATVTYEKPAVMERTVIVINQTLQQSF